VVLDGAMRDLLERQYFPKAKAGKGLGVTVIPNWERLSFFPASEETPEKAWEGIGRLKLEGKFLVIYLGNMGVGHSFETVVAAAKKLQEFDGNVAFLFFGGGKRRKWVEEAKAREKLENIYFQDYLPEKEVTRQAMAAADLALITLRSDMAGVMSPSKLHSNLAMKLPVVYLGPKQSNVDEAIERFGCGVSLRESDVEGLVKFVLENKNDAEKLRRLKETARGAFEAAYCDEKTLPLFEGVLERVVKA